MKRFVVWLVLSVTLTLFPPHNLRFCKSSQPCSGLRDPEASFRWNLQSRSDMPDTICSVACPPCDAIVSAMTESAVVTGAVGTTLQTVDLGFGHNVAVCLLLFEDAPTVNRPEVL